MNKVILIGRLTKQPELYLSQNGTEIVSNSIAVNRNYKNQDGGYDVDFINIVAYRNNAKLIADHCQKGDKIGVTGSIQVRAYTTRDGGTNYVTEIIVDGIEFLQNRTQQAPTPLPKVAPQQNPFNQAQSKPKETSYASYDVNNDLNMEDLPF